MVNKEGRTEGKWTRFRQKIPLIFDTAVRQGRELMKKGISSGDRATILDSVALQLSSLIEHDLDCRDLFGVDFHEINSIEQVCLILFTSLSLAGEKDKPRLVVQLCSRALIPHLLDYQISKKKEDVILEKDHVSIDEIDWQKHRESALSALDRLESLPIGDGFCHSDSARLETVVDGADAAVKELSEILLNPKLKKQPRLLTLLGVVFALVSVAYTFKSGEMMAEILDTKELFGIPTLALISLVNFITVAATYFYTRELPSKESFNTLKNSNFLEIGVELNELIFKEKQFSKIYQSILVIGIFLMFFASTSLNVYSDYMDEVNSLQDSAVTTESSDLPDIPDQISPEAISALPWVFRGNLLNDPEDVVFEKVSPLGYQSDGWFNENGLRFTTAGGQATEGVEVVSAQSEIQYIPRQDEVMYSLGNRSLILLPLDGYRITRLFQVGGKPAQRGTAGEFYFDRNHYPESVVIVAERMQPDENYGNGIVSYAEIRGPDYHPWDSWLESRNDAITLNSKLSSDSQLQQLHLSLIHEIDSLYARWQNGDLQSQEAQMSEEYSNIGQRFVLLFDQFMQSSRYYSLSFSAKDIEGESFLEDIALDQDRAFYCTIASYSLQEFMESVGITVVTKPGNTLYAFEGRLYSRIGHMNAMVVLPNGKILMIDPTPQRPNPGEDLSSLELTPITSEDQQSTPEKKLLQKLTYLIVGSSVLGGTTVSLALLRKEKKRRNRSLKQKIESQLPSHYQQNVLRASYQILRQLVSFSTKDYQKMLNHYGSEDEFLRTVSYDGVKCLLELQPEDFESPDPLEIERMMRKGRNNLDEEFQDSGQDRMLLMRSIESVAQNLKQRAKEEKDFIFSEKERRLNDHKQLSDEVEQIRYEYDRSQLVQQMALLDHKIRDLNTKLSEVEEDLQLIEEHLHILNKTTTSLRRVLNEVLKFLRSK